MYTFELAYNGLVYHEHTDIAHRSCDSVRTPLNGVLFTRELFDFEGENFVEILDC